MADPHVAILIPSYGQRALANLARDAIAAFTEDVSHDVRLLDHAGAKIGWPAPGSKSVGKNLEQLWLGVGFEATHVFVMHDDALPLRPGWLAYLLSKPGPVTGVKESEGTKCAHGSGVLYESEFLRHVTLEANLPARDAGEWPGNWTAKAHPHRQSCVSAQCQSRWWGGFECDVSYHDDGELLYAHLGGGTLNNRPDTMAWIAAAREALGLV